MAHFAKLNNDNIVEQVVVVHNDIATSEEAGVTFLNNMYGTNDVWKQTSYNTIDGTHKLGGTPFRKNYATIGGTYDPDKDAFIPPKLYDSWILNDFKCSWEAPIPLPDNAVINGGDVFYDWDEENTNWKPITD